MPLCCSHTILATMALIFGCFLPDVSAEDTVPALPPLNSASIIPPLEVGRTRSARNDADVVPLPPNTGMSLIANVPGTTKANDAYWAEKCKVIPSSTLFLVLDMGTVRDFFKPADATTTYCEMLQARNKHQWSPNGVDWFAADFLVRSDYNGGSAEWWPRDKGVEGDARKFLSFWGSEGFGGGCCSTSPAVHYTGSWKISFTLSYALPLPPLPLNIGMSLVANVAGTTKTKDAYWAEKCKAIPSSTLFLVLDMGAVRDFFKPADATTTYCEMLQARNKHQWSPNGVDWFAADFLVRSDYNGGSAEWWPRDKGVEGDARKFLSFWGSEGFGGGCCSTSPAVHYTGSWKISFTLSYALPLPPLPLNIGMSLVANVAGTTKTKDAYWAEKCKAIPSSTLFLVLDMGAVRDFFKPVDATTTYCEMLQANNKHQWSPNGVDWFAVEFYSKYNGGSASWWPRDKGCEEGARQYLSFWGRDIVSSSNPGGCCSTSTAVANTGWGQSFTLSYGLPLQFHPPHTVAAEYVKVQQLETHTNDVMRVAFSPSGNVMVTVSDDRTAIVYNSSTPGKYTKLQQLEDHAKEVKGVAFSPSGTVMVTVSTDKTAIVYDASTPGEYTKLQQLKDHEGRLRDVAFSPNGNVLVTVVGDVDKAAIVYVYDSSAPGDYKKLQQLKDHDETVYAVAFSPTGNIMVTVSPRDKTAIVYDASTPGNYTQLQQLKDHTDNVIGVTFSPSGNVLVTVSYDDTAIVYDSSTPGKYTKLQQLNDHAKVEDGLIKSASFSPSGTIMVTVSSDKTAIVYNSSTPGEYAKLQQLDDHAAAVIDATFSPSGNVLVTVSDDDTAIIYKARCPGNDYYQSDADPTACLATTTPTTATSTTFTTVTTISTTTATSTTLITATTAPTTAAPQLPFSGNSEPEPKTNIMDGDGNDDEPKKGSSTENADTDGADSRNKKSYVGAIAAALLVLFLVTVVVGLVWWRRKHPDETPLTTTATTAAATTTANDGAVNGTTYTTTPVLSVENPVFAAKVLADNGLLASAAGDAGRSNSSPGRKPTAHAKTKIAGRALNRSATYGGDTYSDTGSTLQSGNHREPVPTHNTNGIVYAAYAPTDARALGGQATAYSDGLPALDVPGPYSAADPRTEPVAYSDGLPALNSAGSYSLPDPLAADSNGDAEHAADQPCVDDDSGSQAPPRLLEGNLIIEDMSRPLRLNSDPLEARASSSDHNHPLHPMDACSVVINDTSRSFRLNSGPLMPRSSSDRAHSSSSLRQMSNGNNSKSRNDDAIHYLNNVVAADANPTGNLEVYGPVIAALQKRTNVDHGGSIKFVRKGSVYNGFGNMETDTPPPKLLPKAKGKSKFVRKGSVYTGFGDAGIDAQTGTPPKANSSKFVRQGSVYDGFGDNKNGNADYLNITAESNLLRSLSSSGHSASYEPAPVIVQRAVPSDSGPPAQRQTSDV